MRFNSNQKYTRWSIRRLSVGVASVVVASGFFVLVGQPSSVHADEVNLTPAQVVPNPSSVTEKSELPENFLKEAVDTALPENQTISSSKEAVYMKLIPQRKLVLILKKKLQNRKKHRIHQKLIIQQKNKANQR